MAGENEVIPTADPETNYLFIANYEVTSAESYYWSAPSSFIGNLLPVYGQMSIVADVGWEAMRGDTSGHPTHGPNIIILVRIHLT